MWLNGDAVADALKKEKREKKEEKRIKNENHFYSEHPQYGELMPLGGPFLTNGELNFIKQWLWGGGRLRTALLLTLLS